MPKTIEEKHEDHLDRFSEVVKGLGLSKLIASKIAIFIHYEVMSAKKHKDDRKRLSVDEMNCILKITKNATCSEYDGCHFCEKTLLELRVICQHFAAPEIKPKLGDGKFNYETPLRRI